MIPSFAAPPHPNTSLPFDKLRAPPLVLASTSPFRRELLGRLGVPFATRAPEVDETPCPGELPATLVSRLAVSKAKAAANAFPCALIIGSDQVSVIGTEILGKPHTHARATQQLRKAAGQRVDFLTGLCVYNSATATAQVDVIAFSVYFRALDSAQIERYLQQERPYNCAGSFKSEGLGISLLERMEGSDPTALIGLPLIRLTAMLAQEGCAIP